jgi:hypothetical protein
MILIHIHSLIVWRTVVAGRGSFVLCRALRENYVYCIIFCT